MKQAAAAFVARRFARLTARAVTAQPGLWPVFRRPLRALFDVLAPFWEARRDPGSLVSLGAALDRLEFAPRRILDLGTGTGLAARFLANRYPDATVVGADLSPAMLAQARRLTTSDRIAYDVADASRLPYADGSFDLVVLLNMIPFFDELARVTAPDGVIVLAFSSGPSTPIYVAPDVVRRELGGRGFAEFEDIETGAGTAVVVRRAGAPA